MKQCAHCKEFKHLDEFAYSNRILKSRQKHCRACMSDFNKASYNKRKTEYRQNIYDNREKRRLDNRQFVWNYLSTHPCVDCGERDPRLLEFDHVRGNKKENISQLATGRYSFETIQKEISKCEVRCANCHRRKTHEEPGWFSG
jgi:hypothetical protein